MKNATGGKKMTSKYTYLLVLLPFLVVVVLFELLPLIMLIIDSFGSDTDKTVLFTLENYKKIFTTLSYKTAIKNSLIITVFSTIVGIVKSDEPAIYINPLTLAKQINTVNSKVKIGSDYNHVVNYLNMVIEKLQEYLSQFNCEVFSITEHEKVLLLEKTLVIYVGVKGSRSSFRDKTHKNGNVIDRYSIIIQELTYNELYNQPKFSKFVKTIHLMDGIQLHREETKLQHQQK